ncbi:MAG: hypothetical protein LH624_03155 [Cryobacterium sp.]|nr:hypothetical protein [Cryobacterium sp.]
MKSWKISKSAITAVLACGLSLVMVGGFLQVPQTAAAFSASEFDPAFVISDENFFDGGSMNAGQIQQFLNQQVPTCSGSRGEPCLKSYRETTTSREAGGTRRCGPYAGAENELASAIIAKVAQACNISPKVLLVTLQKEQGLVTQSSPSATQYRIAMGYGCPDTAPCDAQYYGFYNQVYRAAKQFREYTVSASSWRYRVGPVAVQFHPKAACGSTTVNIRNQATANLYNYTPYQPNAASLGNLYGTGDACSSYGNRNFWRTYYDWFGNPASVADTFASLDVSELAYEGAGASIRLAGWSLDPAALARSIEVHAYVTRPDGSTKGYVANPNQSRPDVGAAYPGAGAHHGYSFDVPVTAPGAYRTCLYSIRASGSALFGCQNFVAERAAPDGQVDDAAISVSSNAATLSVRGWAVDDLMPTKQLEVHVYVTDPAGTTTGSVVRATQARGDVALHYPAAGPNHGFAYQKPVTMPGTYRVCSYAIGTPMLGDNNTLLACNELKFGPSKPVGNIDSLAVNVTSGAARIDVQGWTLDDALRSVSTEAHVYVTTPSGVTAGQVVKAAGPRADVSRAYAGAGANHGFTFSKPITEKGLYRVCVYGMGASVFGGNTQLTCENLRFGPSSPQGSVDTVGHDPATNTLSASGWVLDNGFPSAATQSHIYVEAPDGTRTGYVVAANDQRTDIARAYPGAGAAHGFTFRVAAPTPGRYRVCAYSMAAPILGSGNLALPCTTVIAGAQPIGSVDTVETGTANGQRTVGLEGWGLDEGSPSTSTNVVVTATSPAGDVTSRVVQANRDRPDIARVIAGAGPAHGFLGTVPVASSGEYRVCAVALSAPVFSTPKRAGLGCKTIAVP